MEKLEPSGALTEVFFKSGQTGWNREIAGIAEERSGREQQHDTALRHDLRLAALPAETLWS